MAPRHFQTALCLVIAFSSPSPAFAAPPRPAPHRAVRIQQSRPLRLPKVKPMITREILVLKLARADKGLLVLAKTRATLKKKKQLPRFRGPFEVRIYANALLRDVVTFSFPLTLPAGERTRNNVGLDKALLPKVQAKTTVRIPWAPELTHLVLVDKLRRTFVRHMLRSVKASRATLKAAKRGLPGPKRTDSLGARSLFGAPLAPTGTANEKAKNKRKTKQREKTEKTKKKPASRKK